MNKYTKNIKLTSLAVALAIGAVACSETSSKAKIPPRSVTPVQENIDTSAENVDTTSAERTEALIAKIEQRSLIRQQLLNIISLSEYAQTCSQDQVNELKNLRVSENQNLPTIYSRITNASTEARGIQFAMGQFVRASQSAPDACKIAIGVEIANLFYTRYASNSSATDHMTSEEFDLGFTKAEAIAGPLSQYVENAKVRIELAQTLEASRQALHSARAENSSAQSRLNASLAELDQLSTQLANLTLDSSSAMYRTSLMAQISNLREASSHENNVRGTMASLTLQNNILRSLNSQADSLKYTITEFITSFRPQ